MTTPHDTTKESLYDQEIEKLCDTFFKNAHIKFNGNKNKQLDIEIAN